MFTYIGIYELPERRLFSIPSAASPAWTSYDKTCKRRSRPSRTPQGSRARWRILGSTSSLPATLVPSRTPTEYRPPSSNGEGRGKNNSVKMTDLIVVVVVFLCSDVLGFTVVINYDMVMIRSAEASDTEGLVRLGDFKAIIRTRTENI